MKAWMPVLTLLCFGAGAAEVASNAPYSVYSDLSDRGCTMVRSDAQEESASWRCPGVQGWRLIRHEDDLRVSLDLVPPEDRAQPLEFWTTVTSAFSGMGQRAEWRMHRDAKGKPQPHALIVRVNAQDEPARADHRSSSLVVSRVDAANSCVVGIVAPEAGQNAHARKMADRAAELPCLQATQ